MTDELNNETQETQTNEVKSLSQDEMNNIVKQRLARQKKEFEGQLEQYRQEAEEGSRRVTEYETILNSLFESQVADMPEPMKELFQKLSVSEKVEWLSKHKDEVKSFDKQTIPTTPKGNGDDKQFKPNTKNIFKI